MELSAGDINALVLGKGDALIMLHGWARSLEDLKPLGEILSANWQVHILDLPGFGKTPPPPEEGWDTINYASLVTEYIKQQGFSKVSLLGHSFGGRVSLRIAAKHPALVNKMILIDSHGLKPIRSVYQSIRVFMIKKAAKIIKFVDKIFGLQIYSEKFAIRFGSADYRTAGVLKNTFVKTISEDQSADVATIKTQTLLLWGSEDRETPVSLGKRFNELLKASKLIVLEGKDHSPFKG